MTRHGHRNIRNGIVWVQTGHSNHARVGNDAKQVQSALCTRMRNVFFSDPTWAQEVCVKREMSLSCQLSQAVMCRLCNNITRVQQAVFTTRTDDFYLARCADSTWHHCLERPHRVEDYTVFSGSPTSPWVVFSRPSPWLIPSSWFRTALFSLLVPCWT